MRRGCRSQVLLRSLGRGTRYSHSSNGAACGLPNPADTPGRVPMQLKAGLIACSLLAGAALPMPAAAKLVNGAVFTMTNSATQGNEVVTFERAANGSLSLLDAVPTGGVGS